MPPQRANILYGTTSFLYSKLTLGWPIGSVLERIATALQPGNPATGRAQERERAECTKHNQLDDTIFAHRSD